MAISVIFYRTASGNEPVRDWLRSQEIGYRRLREVTGSEREMIMKNPHLGSSMQSLFEELGEWEEMEVRLEKRMIADVLRREMKRQKVTKAELAKKMETSRSQIDALLNGENTGLTLTTLTRVARALGLHAEISFKPRQPAT